VPTVTKTWTFTAGAEGLTEVDFSPYTTFAYYGALGNPAGCIHFRTDGTPNQSGERARGPAGQTWESWGVPAGAIVTNAQITAWQAYAPEEGYGATDSGGVGIRIVNASNIRVHSATDLISMGFGAPIGYFVAQAAGASQAIDAIYQASTTPVKLEIDGIPIPNDNDSSYGGSLMLDNIQLTITYTAGGGGFAAKARRILSQLAQRVGSRQAR